MSAKLGGRKIGHCDTFASEQRRPHCELLFPLLCCFLPLNYFLSPLLGAKPDSLTRGIGAHV